jgi:glycosyltransferase involved in cell wall biosynthesis
VRTSLGVGARDVVLGFVGRLSSQKAPDVLVRAFARITPVAPHVHLVVAGDGPMRDGLVRLTGSLGLADAVTFLGHVDASSLMQAFDVMVIPSRYEGLPYVALEALNAGLPIIATTAAGCELVVQPGVNGRVVPVDDPVALADAIIPYTTDSRLRRAASCASLQRAPAFSLETMVESTLAVYDRALDERAPGHRQRRSS